eukprot:CAMPEP_0181212580 /NCGR_PEP_ID=MMETSP1096-20121128/24426_1 /TAXON_ID=156174 ORGANISM="Chrysochromulina ericina, Strain CCMP281" /NCGR_SAMPLE_ID=MMETSP1096 /ASSEMBLY_ACC=CAM_ASM_000453 /LENGTH=129 /DNA_ID=CAMNT_0023304119 /DNA_START=386 /DNA_END=775 /DNA_ORIENTATION=-
MCAATSEEQGEESLGQRSRALGRCMHRSSTRRRIDSFALGDEEEGGVAKGAVDRTDASLGCPTPLALDELACPLNLKPSCGACIPRCLNLRGDRAVACQPPPNSKQGRRGCDRTLVARQVKDDAVVLVR